MQNSHYSVYLGKSINSLSYLNSPSFLFCLNLLGSTNSTCLAPQNVRISGKDFKVEMDNLEGLRLDQGAIVDQGKLGSDLIIFISWEDGPDK